MKELKFRVWDGELMHYNARVGGFDETRPTVYKCCGIISEWVNVEPLSQDEIMQYTGLKDKNGKEIYEGDIVRWGESEPNIDWNGTVKGEVYWLDGGFWVACKESNHFSGRIDETGHFEIIGNIYENPDMISNQPLTNK